MGLLKLHPHKNGSILALKCQTRHTLEVNSVRNDKGSSSKFL